MSKIYEAPASSTTMLHGAEQMAATANPDNAGAMTITAWNGIHEVFDLCIFTRDATMAVELAAAINGVLVRHDRLNTDRARAVA